MKRLITTLLILLTLNCTGKEYRNPHCQLYVKKQQREQFSYAINDIIRLLKEKHYQVTTFAPQEKLGPGKDYLHLIAQKKSGAFPPCATKITIYRTKGVVPSELDQIMWSNEAIRKLPRTTFKGKIRCKYAFKDTLASLPNCD